jgi:hypothetical protein
MERICLNCYHWREKPGRVIGRSTSDRDWRVCHHEEVSGKTAPPLVETHRNFGCRFFDGLDGTRGDADEERPTEWG